MRKIYKQLWFLLLGMVACIAAAMGQSIRVEIIVKSVYVDYTVDTDGSYGGRFRFYYNTPEDRCGPMLNPFCGDANRRCIRTSGKFFSGDVDESLNAFNISGTSFTIFMRTHHERQKDCTSRDSDECTVENLGCGHPDRHELTTSMGVNLANFQPGVWVTLGTMTNQDNSTASATLLMRYSVPTPVMPAPQPNPALTTFCAQDVLELSTNVLPNNVGLQYNWQYALESENYDIQNPDRDPLNYEDPMYGCGHWEYDPWFPPDYQYWVSGWDCHLPYWITVQNWKTLPITNSSADRFARFTPLQAVFNNNITERSNVYFRTQASSPAAMVSGWSTPSTYTILPAPPTLTTPNFTIKPSCTFPNTGQVVIPYNAINTPFSQVRWLLKNGHSNNGTCNIVFNPDGTISSNCGIIERQSDGLINVPKSAADAAILIDNLPKGPYTLWMINPGENTGACYTPVDITIGEYPALTLNKLDSNNISCFGADDGAFRLQAGGGDPNSGYQFKLVAKNHPALNIDFTTITGDIFQRTGLPADEYTISMQNACMPKIDIVITLTEPLRTKATAIFNQPTCYNPANGAVVLDVLQGMGNYTYQLWQGSTKVKETAAVSGTHLVFDQLSPGNYTARVLDANRLTCLGWDTAVALIAPPVLGTTVKQVDSVSCYGGADGVIQVHGTGAANRYVFTLRRNGNTVSSGTDSTFSNLVAGAYELTTSRPADENCNDTSMQTIIVPQRSQLTVSLDTVPVTCNGQDNGSIRARASGGSGSYEYYWEYWNGTAWQHSNFWFPEDVQISQLSPGRYRVSVSDKRSTLNCKIVSDEVTITEPGIFLIAAVQATDAACKDDGGRIKITTTGGNGNNQYYYSIGDKLHYTLFTENTPLTATGDYYVKVVDAKGCSVESDTAHSIDLPAAPMEFTMEASDYEGTSVSCYNGNNGRITVTASGGSGSGYQYQLGSGAFQASPVFEQLAAGQHMVTVKDTRGCVINSTITLTQPAVPIQGTITDKNEVDCPGTPTGAFRIVAQNGRPPYQYSIDNGVTFQDGNFFTGLQTGTYHVVVKDKYNCTWTKDEIIVSLITPVQFAHAIKNVSCYDGSDGAVTVTATNGVAPYQYQWQTPANTTNQLAGLKAGNYALLVTDAAGCLNHDTVTISQPLAALSAIVKTQPVCVGSNGHITVAATGGTPPYRYATNNKPFQDNPVLADLGAGTYTVVVKDNNNCEATYTAVINPANAMPEINFLVASGKNALDTLVIREISLPAPDSVQFSFDPAAQVLEAGQSPRIKFSQPGNYWVSMTGHFKGCAYTLRKTIYINPYDPDAGLVYTPPIRIIDTVILFPNPNNGQFSVKVKMNRKQKLILMVQEMGTGREVVRRAYDPALATDDQFTLGSVAPGTYVLRVLTENESRDILFVINR